MLHPWAYLPDFTAVLMALSAWLKPSAEPGTRKHSVSQAHEAPLAPCAGQGLTDGNGGDLCVLLGRQVLHVPTGIVARH